MALKQNIKEESRVLHVSVVESCVLLGCDASSLSKLFQKIRKKKNYIIEDLEFGRLKANAPPFFFFINVGNLSAINAASYL
jgi:hypothetical protein